MNARATTNWPAIAAVYGAAFLQGLALVSFPASSSTLRTALSLSDAQYGAIFLPQVAAAAIGALTGGALALRIGLQRLLWLALLANGASQTLLALASAQAPAPGFASLLAGTACLGLGFGLLGAPMNSYPQQFFPRRRETAVIAVHTLVGVGLTVGPLGLTAATLLAGWIAFPLSLLGACILLAVAAARLRFPAGTLSSAAVARRPAWRTPAFWLFATIAVLYAFAEGTFSNWAVVYLQEVRQLPAATAALALTAFWGTLVAGRLLISALVLRVPAAAIWLMLPLLMAACFALLPGATTATAGVGLFALSGLACSAFFPLTIAIASRWFADDIAWVSSMLIAALMVGVGLGTFAVGALREMLEIDALYRLSVAYPLAAFALVCALQMLRAPPNRVHAPLPQEARV